MQKRRPYPLSWAVIAGGIMIVAASPGILNKHITQSATSMTLAENPPIPRFEDRNGDGIEDKITKVQVFKPGRFPPLTGYYALEDEVLYGLRIDGKTAYLPKGFYETLQRYAQPHK